MMLDSQSGPGDLPGSLLQAMRGRAAHKGLRADGLASVRRAVMHWMLFFLIHPAIHGWVLPQSQPPDGKVLTLQEAVNVALKQNPTVQSSDAYVEAVRHAISAAKAGYYPRV